MRILLNEACLIFLLCVLIVHSINAQSSKLDTESSQHDIKLELAGKIKGLKENEVVYFKQWDWENKENELIDSIVVKDESFFFEYQINEGPRLFWIQFSNHNHIIAIPLVNEKVTLVLDKDIDQVNDQSLFKHIRVEGSEISKQHLYLAYAVYNCWYFTRNKIDR